MSLCSVRNYPLRFRRISGVNILVQKSGSIYPGLPGGLRQFFFFFFFGGGGVGYIGGGEHSVEDHYLHKKWIIF